jgi:hypothetical protein
MNKSSIWTQFISAIAIATILAFAAVGFRHTTQCFHEQRVQC